MFFNVSRVSKSMKNLLGGEVGTNFEAKLAYFGCKMVEVGPKMRKVHSKMPED